MVKSATVIVALSLAHVPGEGHALYIFMRMKRTMRSPAADQHDQQENIVECCDFVLARSGAFLAIWSLSKVSDVSMCNWFGTAMSKSLPTSALASIDKHRALELAA
eukprot:5639789-Amphidinium_carterae.1